MARPKISRKSTWVDMTAMCDVAFLLLSFFILATKFKPAEAVPVNIPSSVSSKVAPEKDVVLVTLTKDGKVFLAMDDNAKKAQVISEVNTSRNLGLTEDEINKLVAQPAIGVPLSQLKQQAQLPKDKINELLPGIPAKDSANNEMIDWMRAENSVYTGSSIKILLKGDNLAKYPSFKNILSAFKKNDFLKFQMVTNPYSVPEGSELWREAASGELKVEQ